MRELKFRAWLNDAKKWIDVNGLEVWRDGQASPSNQTYVFLITGKLIHPIDLPETTEIQQYTGIKDVNGKEIYEGDIVEMDNSLMVVEYSEEFGAFVAEVYKVDEEETEQSYHYYADEYRYCKVIGNIFENKELIL